MRPSENKQIKLFCFVFNTNESFILSQLNCVLMLSVIQKLSVPNFEHVKLLPSAKQIVNRLYRAQHLLNIVSICAHVFIRGHKVEFNCLHKESMKMR